MTIPPVLLIPQTTNLSPNPRAQTSVTGWTGWTYTFTRETSTYVEAPASFRATRASVGGGGLVGGCYQRITVTPGAPFSTQLMVRGDGSTVGTTHQLVVEWYDGAMAMVSSNRGAVFTLTDEWAPHRFEGMTVPPGAVTAHVGIFTHAVAPALGASFLFSHHQPEMSPRSTPYTDTARAEQRLPGFLRLGSPHIGPLRAGKV